jgi:type IV secretory pathway TrbD component
MATEEPRDDRDNLREEVIPPATEVVHLPGPTYLPVVVAFGLALAVSGLVLSWILVGLGLVIFLISTYLWVRDTRRDISELPLEHGHP